MLHKQAKKLAYFLTQQNIIETGNENIYAYGLELILSGSIGISLVIISSVILGYPSLFIPFLLGYISYRVNAGGFHAKSLRQLPHVFPGRNGVERSGEKYLENLLTFGVYWCRL